MGPQQKNHSNAMPSRTESDDIGAARFLVLPTACPSFESEVRNMIDTFAIQFGNRVTSTGVVCLPEERGLAKLVRGGAFYRPVLLAAGINAPREVQVRLIAHEVEHSRQMDGPEIECRIDEEVPCTSNDFNSLQRRLRKNEGFQELIERVDLRFKEILELPDGYRLLLRPKEPEHYAEVYEMMAKLRAYQVYLNQGDSAGAPEPHEFIEAFKPTDLRWLDFDYCRSECAAIVDPPTPTFRLAGGRGIKGTLPFI